MAACLVALIPGIADASDLTLSPLFSDHMVLQREQPLPVWGKARPGDKVRIELQAENGADPFTTTVVTQADAAGAWQAHFGPMPPGGPFRMSVRLDGNSAVAPAMTLRDVLIGDVWLCSGQSNMGMTLSRTANAAAEIEQSGNARIRLLAVPRRPSLSPETTLQGSAAWAVCGPSTGPSFSAVAYYFGRDLQKHLHVPVGLIQSSVGGTSAECWMSREGLRDFPEFTAPLAKLQEEAADPEIGRRRYHRESAKWYAQLRRRDPGFETTAPRRSARATTSTAAADAPGPFTGTVWFRRSVDLPSGWNGTTLSLSLGSLPGEDTVWFNDALIGETTASTVTASPRHYQVPAPLARAGRNTVTVRLLGTFSGNTASAAPPELTLSRPGGEKDGVSGGTTLSSPGEWTFRRGISLSALPRRPLEEGHPRRPTVLYNGMISPLIPFALKGVIWYQGESNTSRAEQYRRLFPALIRDWRARWNAPDLPFLFVQLPIFQPRKAEPGEDPWAELREAQFLTHRQVPRTAMACVIDTGDARDIHPREKEPVGSRLALAARAVAYGEKLVWSGPLFTTATLENKRFRVAFEHTGSGLMARDGSPEVRGFAVAGPDRKFVWADARIDSATNTVLVSSPKVPQPVAVRYAWAANPDASLSNREGLPASPFRSDQWPGLTDGNTKDSAPAPE